MNRSLLALLICGSFFGLMTTLASSLLYQDCWILLAFFGCLAWLNHQLVERGITQDNFVQFYLASTVLRLMLGLVYLGVRLWLGEVQPDLLIYYFLGMYFFFMGFELWEARRKLRQFSEKQAKNITQ